MDLKTLFQKQVRKEKALDDTGKWVLFAEYGFGVIAAQ